MGAVAESIPDEIQVRLANAGLLLTSEQAAQLMSYFGLLTKWNKTINLTALALDPPTPQTLDRLLVERARNWNAAGRPPKGVRVRAYAKESDYTPSENEIVVERQHTRFVIELGVNQ